ncbi:hypothetical protein O7602_06985 [Micromonospora sp. WMMD1128]|uniref:hypothetical protein n=1 Tax=unclassified Micromonospora TaxID=2617518 RepID=UPI00248CCFAA|nr:MULTISPECIES: hypothetical protein [unclassified Micromonospora]WBB75258.1 hypothetical protein O7602_06985 [Micromonospora sp. WMMD1128]WFE31350.1 hypothetical protein O7613_17140 [Micromonospora sp. WMMD975]
MGTTDPGSAREEAERLVVSLLAAARLATTPSGPGGPLGGILSGVLGHTAGGNASGGAAGFATGSPECCVCPVCRGIAALRDPSPEFAERLATGAGDLAAGVASVLRAFAPGEPAERPEPAEPAGPDGRDEPAATTTPAGAGGPAPAGAGDHVWREATRTGHDSQPAPEQDVWSAATRDEPAASRPPAGRPVVPASRASGEAGADAPGDGA